MGDSLASQHRRAQDRHAATDAARALPANDAAGTLPGGSGGGARRIAGEGCPSTGSRGSGSLSFALRSARLPQTTMPPPLRSQGRMAAVRA
ncbi:hypothetical protein ACFSUK_23970 [Sphingobium scionense]